MGGKVSETSDSTALRNHYHDLSATTETTVTGRSNVYIVKVLARAVADTCR